MGAYFQNIKSGFTTAFEGMSISFATMFVRKETVQYPEVDISTNETIAKKYKGSLMGMPENYRGILNVELSLCTACQICQKACPIDCIIIDNTKCDKSKLSDADGNPILNRFTQKEALKTRTVTRFDINAGKCMYCGLCEKACPTAAIKHTNQFEMNRESQEELILRFVSDEVREEAEKRTAEIDAEAAAKKAAKAKKQAEEKAKEAEPKEKGAEE
jgi:NAD(P)H-quinone oxidoreductase subunit I